MPRRKPAPLPDVTVHNLRKRAQQLHVIAAAMESAAARASLEARAADLVRQAESVEHATVKLSAKMASVQDASGSAW